MKINVDFTDTRGLRSVPVLSTTESYIKENIHFYRLFNPINYKHFCRYIIINNSIHYSFAPMKDKDIAKVSISISVLREKLICIEKSVSIQSLSEFLSCKISIKELLHCDGCLHVKCHLGPRYSYTIINGMIINKEEVIDFIQDNIHSQNFDINLENQDILEVLCLD